MQELQLLFATLNHQGIAVAYDVKPEQGNMTVFVRLPTRDNWVRLAYVYQVQQWNLEQLASQVSQILYGGLAVMTYGLPPQSNSRADIQENGKETGSVFFRILGSNVDLDRQAVFDLAMLCAKWDGYDNMQSVKAYSSGFISAFQPPTRVREISN